jgi:hypothetical protein
MSDTLRDPFPQEVFTKETCPKSDEWFANGGRCGWAHACDFCLENPNDPKGH